ncbi:MAG: helix-turn-helix transcriptional regulator [Thermomicrobiales bacterium]|nr:helix-turn-helix transcriptional regulator [Thermomicrobiales bacterium]MCO5224679.1 helix-turn-helix transcriptional regulator [Thermomicrobiales bacterium]MCO5226664.1 helix-turn-helix transcriptional regulator [Thermomicrobiales bacterium]
MDDHLISQSGMNELLRSEPTATPERRHIARTFPDLLVKLREERGLSKAELAKKAGLDPSSITRFEAAQRAPERLSIIQIADAMVLPAMDRDRLLASAGFRSEIWDDPAMVDLVMLLNDDEVSAQAKAEVRSVLRMATAFLRLQRMNASG